MKDLNHIEIITQDFFPIEGGITTWVHEIAMNIFRERQSVGVTCKGRLDKPWDDDLIAYPVTRLPDKRWRNKKYSYIAKRLRELDPETMIIAASWKIALGIARYNILHKPFPYIVHVHGKEAREQRFFNRLLKNFALKKSMLITTGAENVKKIIQKDISHPIEIVHPGVDIERHRPMDVPDQFFRKYGIPKGSPILLSFGRLVERKGFDMVLRAMPKILEKHSDLIYVIAGRGPQEEELGRLTMELDLAQQIVFTGFVGEEDTALLYNACDVYIMPSRRIKNDIEGFGITYIEANACGKPVIGGDSGGVPDAVEHGKSGLLVDPESIDSIAHSVIDMFSKPQMRHEMGEYGRQRAIQSFQWKDVANRYMELFREGLSV